MKSLNILNKLLNRLGLDREAQEVNLLLKEATPLFGFDSHEIVGAELNPSPGYGLTEEEVAEAKEIMKSTDDKWVIISISSLKAIESMMDFLQQEGFKNWLKEKNYPSDARILILSSPRMGGDYTDPSWVLHDAIGHAIEKSFSGSLADVVEEGVEFGLFLIKLQSLLPESFRNSKTIPDMIPDILSGILFKYLDKESGKKAISLVNEHFRRIYKDKPEKLELYNKSLPDTERRLEEIWKDLFDAPKKWIKKLDDSVIQVGDNKVNINILW